MSIGFAKARGLAIETPQLTGSIALMGARFDDLVLRGYGATPQPPTRRAKFCCSARAKPVIGKHHGFVAAPGSAVTLPDAETRLAASSTGRTLTPTAPVTLQPCHAGRRGAEPRN